jgi:hypothetical protein
VGTAGVFNMSAQDHNGLSLDAFEMLTVKNGKFVPYVEKAGAAEKTDKAEKPAKTDKTEKPAKADKPSKK